MDWQPVGGNGGLPSDMLDSDVEGVRRLKVRTELNELIETAEDGNRGLAIYDQDQITGQLDLYFLQQKGVTSLAADTVVDDRNIELSPGQAIAIGVAIGDTIEIADSSDGECFIQCGITNVTGDTIELDSPCNRVYTAGASFVVVSSNNMAVDGSLEPQSFKVAPLATQKGDVNRNVLVIINGANMDFQTFGSRPALTNGLVLRKYNGDGTYRHIFNFKNNGEIELFAATDAQYFENNANNARGFSARASSNGKDKHGVVIRLDGAIGQYLELLVQDDLTTQDSIVALAQGSEIQDL